MQGPSYNHRKDSFLRIMMSVPYRELAVISVLYTLKWTGALSCTYVGFETFSARVPLICYIEVRKKSMSWRYAVSPPQPMKEP